MLSKEKKMYLLGKDIQHSLSPKFYNEYFSSHNLNIEYKLFDTNDIKNFLPIMNDENTIGFNVTMPYKKDIISYISSINDVAMSASAVNLVIKENNKFIGYNTDGIGFFNSLIKLNIELKDKALTIVGHGGAGKAITSAAKNYGIKKINIITHSMSNTSNDIATYKQILGMLLDADIIVNATPIGFSNDNNFPIDIKILQNLVDKRIDFTFVDIIYNPLETPLLHFMKNKGVKNAFNGTYMLKGQFDENLRLLRL